MTPWPMLSARLAATLLIAVIVAAVPLAWANVFSGRFVLDDPIEIVANPALRTLWPPWIAMTGGNQVAARPLPYLTFAIDLALWGPSPAGFHVTNLLVHLATAAGLYLLTESALSPRAGSPHPRGQPAFVAAAAAAVWVVHPLTTAAVTYVYQRIEALAACFMVWSLFCAARALRIPTDDPAGSPPRRRWQAAAIVLAVAAMLSKETAVVLPALVALFWWIFGMERDPRPRLPFLAGIAATWGVLAAVLRGGGARYAELGQAVHPPLLYLLTQAQVILHYLRLCIWPFGLCLDYDWPLADGIAATAGPGSLLLLALGTCAIGAARRRVWAFPGLAFFMLLAPTSSVLPVADVAFDHRMYLPLYCVVVLIVGAGWWALGRALPRAGAAASDGLPGGAVALTAVVVLALAWATQLRNRDFQDPRILWTQALDRNPRAFRANWWAAVDAARRGDVDAALEHAARSTRRMPNGLAFHEVARVFHEAGDVPAWERACRAGIATLDECAWGGRPTWFDLHALLAESLLARGAVPAAAEVCRTTIPQARAALPKHHAITIGLRLALLRCELAGNPAAADLTTAQELLRDAVAGLGTTHPKALAVRSAVAVMHDRAGNFAAAEGGLREVVRLQAAAAGVDADAGASLETLADFLASHDRHDETVPLWNEILGIRRRRFGAEHPHTLAAGRRLTKALEMSGRSTESSGIRDVRAAPAGPDPPGRPPD